MSRQRRLRRTFWSMILSENRYPLRHAPVVFGSGATAALFHEVGSAPPRPRHRPAGRAWTAAIARRRPFRPIRGASGSALPRRSDRRRSTRRDRPCVCAVAEDAIEARAVGAHQPLRIRLGQERPEPARPRDQRARRRHGEIAAGQRRACRSRARSAGSSGASFSSAASASRR